MNEVTEFATGEQITSVIHMTAIEGCESLQDPLSIGFYNKTDEIFLNAGTARINIPAHLVKSVMAQIKRASIVAKEQSGG